MKRVVFIDRDGTIIREPKDQQIDSLEKLEFIPGIISGLQELTAAGFALVMVSNQDGLGSKQYPLESFVAVQQKIITLLRGEGIAFEKAFVCPHRSSGNCECRKPKLGLVSSYLKRNKIDYANSFVMGDRRTDVLFARNVGCRVVRLSREEDKTADFATSDARKACRFIASYARTAALRRVTHETDIDIKVRLDGEGDYAIATGIGFFDHMLAQLARHSGIDIDLEVIGDLEIDEHHTVEDVGIALGEVIRQALGVKRGIKRFAAPLDESLATVALDLSGRSHLSFSCDLKRERVGELPTELVRDFFQAFADGLRATLHITCTGRNEHHKVEAIFKAVAKALGEAVHIDYSRVNQLPTTKGLL